LQLLISGSFGYSIEWYEMLDSIVEAGKSFQGVGPVDRERRGGRDDSRCSFKRYTIIYRERVALRNFAGRS
jgi:hypothetical protein